MYSKSICVLVPSVPHKRSKSSKFHANSMKYFGLGVVVNEIQKNFDIEVPFIQGEEVKKFDIVLFSLHSVEDFYNLVYTFETYSLNKNDQIFICGGAGIANFEMIRAYFHYIVLGRGENIILPLLSSVLINKPFVHESVVDTLRDPAKRVYSIAYAQQLYPDKVQKREETMYGCKYNCFYCRYRYSALPPNKREFDRETTMPGNEETFWELVIDSSSFYTTSLDGFSEATRYKVNKKISNKAIIEKLTSIPKLKHGVNLKVYFIVGYPHEVSPAVDEFISVMKECAEIGLNNYTNIKVHVTPFSPEPSTPLQWEKPNLNIDFREIMAGFCISRGLLFEGPNLRVSLPPLTASPLTLFKRVLFNRGYAHHLELVKYIVFDKFMKSHAHTNAAKFKHLQEHFILDQFTKKYNIGDPLPSDNIHSWQSIDKIKNMAHKYRSAL